MSARNIPRATRRTSPSRNQEGHVGLNRGIIDSDAREFLSALTRLKKSAGPFPSWTQVFDMFRGLGYSKSPARPDDHPDVRDIKEMRVEMDSRVTAIGVVEKQRAELANDFAEAERTIESQKTAIEELSAENARLVRMLVQIDDICDEVAAVCGAVWVTRIHEIYAKL